MMDAYSSGEEVVIKKRKPYTITKQRERWTEEEHNRFLEALKLHGRAWQRIEEHIGTKTAVQIRSHAQKFFTKLEKEAQAKGVPIGQAIDIEIPPPRPKRKPSNPYPRKTSAGAASLHSGAKDGKLSSLESSHAKQALDLEKEPAPEEAPCSSSVSSANKSSISLSVPLRNSCALREIIPSVKEVIAKDGRNKSFVTIELENRKLEIDDGKQTNGNSSLETSDTMKLVQNEKTDGLNCALTIDGIQGNQNYPRHVTVHVVDGKLGTSTPNPSQDMVFQDSMFQPLGGINGQPNLFTNSNTSNASESQNNTARSSVHQTFLPYPPFTQNNQDDYQSFLQMSSTFSSLIVSTLLQNPAAHAAASFAATFWPCANSEASADSPTCSQGGFPPRQNGSPPSVAAIVAATVAAATAWWAAHGLLPLCAPLHTAFPCPPTSMTAVPSMNIGEAPAPVEAPAPIPTSKTEEEKNIPQNPPQQDQTLDPVCSEAQQEQQSPSKSPDAALSDSEESGDPKLHASLSKATTDQEVNKEITEHIDSNKAKGRKPVDRSSCGSNTTSSSELETDALEKDEQGKEEPETADANNLAIESSNRRSRSVSNLTDSWKEVSEEGRLAFQALFAREVLPQSFSPPPDLKIKDQEMDSIKDNKQTTDIKDEGQDSKKCSSISEGMQKMMPCIENNEEEGLLTIGLGQGKLKTRRTGFKPYKRCSMEAKENRVGSTGNQGEEQGSKKNTLRREAST